jgi:hypothetical protein
MPGYANPYMQGMYDYPYNQPPFAYAENAKPAKRSDKPATEDESKVEEEPT